MKVLLLLLLCYEDLLKTFTSLRRVMERTTGARQHAWQCQLLLLLLLFWANGIHERVHVICSIAFHTYVGAVNGGGDRTANNPQQRQCVVAAIDFGNHQRAVWQESCVPRSVVGVDGSGRCGVCLFGVLSAC